MVNNRVTAIHIHIETNADSAGDYQRASGFVSMPALQVLQLEFDILDRRADRHLHRLQVCRDPRPRTLLFQKQGDFWNMPVLSTASALPAWRRQSRASAVNWQIEGALHQAWGGHISRHVACIVV